MRQILFALIALTLSSATAFADGYSEGSNENREPARAPYSCRLVSGYGTAVGYGSSQVAAQAAAIEICGNKLIDQYFAARGRIDAANVDDLALACVNLACQ